MVKDPIKRIRGAAGLSEIDCEGWRRILISGNYENVEENFRKSIAEKEKRCQEISANYLAAFLACRLIHLTNSQVLDLYRNW